MAGVRIFSTNPMSRTYQLALAAILVTPAFADNAELAKQLSNPVASLISVPIQSNLDFGVGPQDGTRWTTNIQPVIPLSISQDWNLISRTILPVIDQQGLTTGGTSDVFGLGDTTQSLFFSPKNPEPFIWGVGPALLVPTATDDLLGTNQWAAGPTAVILKQMDGWTFGALANQLWDFAGESSASSVNSLYMQPFVSYTTHKATSITLNTETSYDWMNDQWNVPINLLVSQVIKIHEQPIQLFVGGRYYVETPTNGPEWGLRFGLTFLFPKG